MRNLSRRLRRDDRGAAGVMIAVLIAGGVLIGMGALTVDVGQLYVKRAELQNGADAGALAIAQSCARGNCTTSVAVHYADANSKSGLAGVSVVCGSEPLGGCGEGDDGGTSLYQCPPAPEGDDGSGDAGDDSTDDTSYVDVTTSTLMPNGSTLLPPVFAQTLLGNSGYKGSTVYACAQASWGPAAAASASSITFSQCSWSQGTSNGTSYAAPPPYPPNPLPSAAQDQVLKLNSGSGGGSGCSGSHSGASSPGAFGWTSDPGGTCQTGVISGTYTAKTGLGVPAACRVVLAAAQVGRTVLFVPVYTGSSGQGAGTSYTLYGFAAFVVTGYHLPGFFASDWLNPANNCTGSSQCVNGYFTQAILPASGAFGGPDLGATIIRLTG